MGLSGAGRGPQRTSAAAGGRKEFTMADREEVRQRMRRRRHRVPAGPVRRRKRLSQGQDGPCRSPGRRHRRRSRIRRSRVAGHGPRPALARHAGPGRPGLVHAASVDQRGGAFRQRPVRGRRAAHVLPAPELQASPGQRRRRGLRVLRGHRTRALPGQEKRGRLDIHLGSQRGRYPRQALLRLQRHLQRDRLSAGHDGRDAAHRLGTPTSRTTRTPTASTKSTLFTTMRWLPPTGTRSSR